MITRAALWRDTLAAVLAVSALPLAALALLARDEDRLQRIVPQLVSFGVGALLGAAVFQLIPEAYEAASSPRLVPVTVVLGYAAFALVEWLLHSLKSGGRASVSRQGESAHPRSLVWLNFAGDATHNLLDGSLIAATFLVNPMVGVLATVAVSLHELPRELGSFGVYVHGGVPAWQAVRYNVLTALLSTTGAIATLFAGTHAAGLARALLPFAAGNFLYIAVSLLRPLLRRPAPRRLQVARAALIALGLGATAVPLVLRAAHPSVASSPARR